MRRRSLLGGAAALVISCAAPPSTARESASPSPDPLTAVPAAGVWPAQWRGASKFVRDMYAFAASSQGEVLEFIPCYCGCGSAGHKNNRDCYLKQDLGNGRVVLDPHGLGCGTCTGITQDVAAMLGQGTPWRAIRERIDARWAAAGPGTPTPLPPDRS